MKKTYISPDMEVILLQAPMLLSASDPGTAHDEVSDKPELAREFDFYDDDE